MKKLNLILLLLFAYAGIAVGQSSKDEAAVEEVIRKLFKGMELGDSAMVHSTFYSDITMATVYKDKTNAPRIRRESSLNEFLKAVGTPHTEVWYEEIWNVKTQIDGDFAQAWCDYAFYAGKNFSHCGIDAFHFFRTKDGSWKIFHLADTRRKEGCNIPKEIQDRRK
jgi:hypothetical protein